MSKRIGKKAVNKGISKKLKVKAYNIFITSLTILIMGGGIFWIIYNAYVSSKVDTSTKTEYQKILPQLGDSISHNTICMASDIFLGDKQRVVIQNSKMYFACSELCEHQLGIDSVRYAIDPVNHHPVDKAMSIVTLHPDNTGAVIYFESKDTYSKYLKVLNDTAK